MNADGNYLDFGNFGYDTRVAMRRNQEPLRAKYPHLSGYSAFGSNPIMYSDLNGFDKWAAMFIVKQIDSELRIISDKTSKSGFEHGLFVKHENEGNKYKSLPVVTSHNTHNMNIANEYTKMGVNYENHTIIVKAHGHVHNTAHSSGDIENLTNNEKPNYKKDDLSIRFSIVETSDTRYVLEVIDRAKAGDIFQNKIGGPKGLFIKMSSIEQNALDNGMNLIEAREKAIIGIVKEYEGSVNFYKSTGKNKNKLEEVEK